MSDYKEAFEALAGVIGWTGTQDPEKFDAKEATAHLNQKFVSRADAQQDPDILKSVKGRVFGEMEGAFAEASGMSKREFSGKSLDESLTLAFDSLSGKIKTLEASAGKDTDEKVTALNKEIATLSVKYEEAESARSESVQAFDDFKTDSVAKGRRRDIDRLRSRAMQGIEWKDGISDIERAGFESVVNKKFQFDLSEGDEPNLILKDTDGHRIKHATKAGDYADPADTFKSMADEGGLIKKNNVQRRSTFGTRREPDEKPARRIAKPLADKFSRKD